MVLRYAFVTKATYIHIYVRNSCCSIQSKVPLFLLINSCRSYLPARPPALPASHFPAVIQNTILIERKNNQLKWFITDKKGDTWGGGVPRITLCGITKNVSFHLIIASQREEMILGRYRFWLEIQTISGSFWIFLISYNYQVVLFWKDSILLI